MIAKVCGLTNARDADFAAAEGAELLGFVVHAPSPRHCADLAAASAGMRDRAVLVTVGEDPEAMLAAARAAGIQRIQPHVPVHRREHVLQQLKSKGYFILLPWSDEPGQAALEADLYLWEPSPLATGLAGGSGQAHAMAHPPPGPFLLAGGLDGGRLPARWRAMPEEARPGLRGFDAASRLEASPGLKDPAKVSAFIRAAHAISREEHHARH